MNEPSPTPIIGISHFGSSHDGKGITFGFTDSKGKLHRFQCATDGLADILGQLVSLLDLANEKRGYQSPKIGETATDRLHTLAGAVTAVTADGLGVLSFRTQANTRLNFALDLQHVRELEKSLSDLRATLEGMASQQKH